MKMKKNNISTYLLIISIMTFIVLFSMIATKSYDNLTYPLNMAQNNPLSRSIDLDLKTDIINIIESRQTNQLVPTQ